MKLPSDIPCQSWYQAVKIRTSRRKYLSDSLKHETIDALLHKINPLQKILESARIVISSDGFDDIIWTVVGSYGLVTGAETYAVIIQDKNCGDFKAEVEAGLLGEALILEAAANKIDTCWVGGMFEKDEIVSRHEMNESEEIAAITPLGRAREKLTLTEKLAKKLAGSHRRKPLLELCTNNYSEKKLQQLPDWMLEAVKSARLAPSALNRQPWRFEFFPNENKLKLKAAQLKKDHDISPWLDCGIALLHLLLGAKSVIRKFSDDDFNDVEYNLLTPPFIAELSPAK